MWRLTFPTAALLLLSGCANQSGFDNFEYVVANQTVALDKRPWQGKGNLRPWEKGEILEPDGTVSIVISNSCGFVDVTYRAQSLADYLSDAESSTHDLRVVESMGEWCRVRHMIIDMDELLLLRNWHGKRFVEGSAAILRDSLEKPFVVDSDFIENAELGSLVTPLKLEPTSGGCFAQSDLTPEFVEELRAEAALVETSEGMCFERGIYLQTLLTGFSARSEQ